ncbi:xanthine dehydrogenase accessory factor [Paenibacillus sophorae]|uniref:Xanthine dehydrogenase accessory factor n=1 Tax=Paenibacillus sophorae TaxID=1333845 RepID=A0A1H8KX12_9BACL|nr:XdhC family protein [Paenibacillus sophorae]QWU17528.1 XdhC family protein [Paenibacillus sophorae]SEN97361.1 xanthine dehydrogenase accessory factor [Paenibacillus sophorae]
MSVYDIVSHIKRDETPAVLATLIGVEGHSYRKAGAVMLFHEEGTIGSLSPGCLESDLQLRTGEVWKSGMPETVEYDMLSQDDFSWGEAVGCGGKIKVVLEPVKGELRNLLLEAHNLMTSGQSVILRRSRADGSYAYSVESAAGAQETRAVGGWSEASFATLLVPKPRLVLFGPGHDARPIADLAVRAGFRVAITDWREGSLRHDFAAAERVICSPGEAADRLHIGSRDYVLICSHQLQRDRIFLENIIKHKPCYIGIIGSKARIGMLLDGLDAPETLYAPVGLPIGGEGPEEIAVSIIAEMIQVRRSGSRKQPKGADNDESCRNLSGGGAE